MRRIVSVFTILIFVFTMSIPVYSQQSSDIEKLLEEGKKAYAEGNFEKAIEKLSLAISIIKTKSRLVDAYLTLSLTYFTIGNEEKAKEGIKKPFQLILNLFWTLNTIRPDLFRLWKRSEKTILSLLPFEQM